jgi:predicted DNA-binding transcriptional regulator AlpA
MIGLSIFFGCSYCMTKDEFPKPIQLGPRAVAWIEEEVQGWLMERVSQNRL